MNLHNRILRLKQEHSGYGNNGILFSFSLDMCQEIDAASASDSFAEKTVNEILKLLKGYQIGYSEKLKSAFEVYSEYAIFHEIKSKGIPIERVPEGKEARPDFKVSIGDEDSIWKPRCLAGRPAVFSTMLQLMTELTRRSQLKSK